MKQLIANVAEQAGTTEEYNHRFYLRVRDMVNAEDFDGITKEKIPIKLLRLDASAQDGFILTDFPHDQVDAEMLEEYRGGLNAFVHLTLPDEVLVDIEESKCKCAECERTYYQNDIIHEEHGIRIDKFMPLDNTCDDCGSKNFQQGSDPVAFEQNLEVYKEQADELLQFYNYYGTLVDFELRTGYASYDKLKRSIQYNMKH